MTEDQLSAEVKKQMNAQKKSPKTSCRSKKTRRLLQKLLKITQMIHKVHKWAEI